MQVHCRVCSSPHIEQCHKKKDPLFHRRHLLEASLGPSSKEYPPRSSWDTVHSTHYTTSGYGIHTPVDMSNFSWYYWTKQSPRYGGQTLICWTNCKSTNTTTWLWHHSRTHNIDLLHVHVLYIRSKPTNVKLSVHVHYITWTHTILRVCSFFWFE